MSFIDCRNDKIIKKVKDNYLATYNPDTTHTEPDYDEYYYSVINNTYTKIENNKKDNSDKLKALIAYYYKR